MPARASHKVRPSRRRKWEEMRILPRRMPPFSEADAAQLENWGIAPAEADRQLALLREPPPPTRLLRPCTPGDGVEILSEARLPELHARHAEAAQQGRLTKLVPASGAASRMFADLAKFRSVPVTRADLARRVGEGDKAAAALLLFLDEL